MNEHELEKLFGLNVEEQAKNCRFYDDVLTFIDTSKPELFADIAKAILEAGTERLAAINFINKKIAGASFR